MDFQNEIKISRTRKEHRCFLCNRKIPVGFSATKLKGKNIDGDFYQEYLCNTCNILLHRYTIVFVDDWTGNIDGDLFAEALVKCNCATPLQLLNALDKIAKQEGLEYV